MSNNLFANIASNIDIEKFKNLNWDGSMQEYLDLVIADPKITRNSYQRLYDMILSYGSEEVAEHRERITRYKFFSDPISGGRDGIFGMDRALMRLVNVVKSAAMGYGAERRVILLHGPVGSAKSTIARMLKKGLEVYSRTEAGHLYTFAWALPESPDALQPCPMHEEPLKLIPLDQRERVTHELNERTRSEYKIQLEGDLCPFCRYIFRNLMEKHEGDWAKVMKHVRVRRMILSEKDRVGIGTFQPKDEKNRIRPS
jgi:serine protein kinase